MDWTDDAIVLSSRRHGENDIILEVLTRERGRHLGLVHGGASRKRKAALLPGNSLTLSWRARLAEHLGNFTVELRRERAGALLENRISLVGLSAFADVSRAVLPEREPHPAVHDAGSILLDAIADRGFSDWAPLYVRWEIGVLEALGFGLDLSRCAVTGSVENLKFVSPRSGRAVSAAAAEPWRDRLFELPAFLVDNRQAVGSEGSIRAGLRLSGHFLAARVLTPHNQAMPAARARLDALAARESA